METIIPTVQETNLRENGFFLLTQTQIDEDYGGNPDIREFPDGGTVYRRGETAIAEHPVAKADTSLVIRGYWCNAYGGFTEERVYLYEVSPTGDNLIDWGELSGTLEGSPLRTLAWIGFGSVLAALAFYSFVILDSR
jgi:hypothetical protein